MSIGVCVYVSDNRGCVLTRYTKIYENKMCVGVRSD